jgi:hypothetical protein
MYENMQEVYRLAVEGRMTQEEADVALANLKDGNDASRRAGREGLN